MSTAIFLPEQNHDVTTLHIRGYLNESAEFPEFAANISKLILLDCERLEGLNSVAIANWIRWMDGVTAHTEVRLQFCQRQVINSVSTVPQMLPQNSSVESFYVPYFCDGCSAVTHLFFKTANLVYNAGMPKPLEVPEETKCKSCGETASLDVIEKHYFAFLQNHQNK
jgi:hypothetical protein